MGMCKEAEAKSRNGCVHYWRLTSPNGKDTVTGTCRMCGSCRQFPAAVKHDFNDIQVSVTYYEKLSIGGAWL